MYTCRREERAVGQALAKLTAVIAGAAEWTPVGEGKPPVPVFATDGFHIETGRTADGEALVICDACDKIIAA